MRRVGKRNKGVTFRNWAPFTVCISEINNNQIDNTKYIDIVMPMYSLIECSNNYSIASGSLSQYYRDEPNDNIATFESFQFKVETTGNTPNDDNKKMLK